MLSQTEGADIDFYIAESSPVIEDSAVRNQIYKSYINEDWSQKDAELHTNDRFHMYLRAKKKLELSDYSTKALLPYLQEIATRGTFNGHEIPVTDFPSEKSEKSRKNAIIKAMRLLSSNPVLLQVIVEEQAAVIHGTRSGALIQILKHGLLPTIEQPKEEPKLVVGEVATGTNDGVGKISYYPWFVDEYSVKQYAGNLPPRTIDTLRQMIKELTTSISGFENNPQYLQGARRAIVRLYETIKFLEDPDKTPYQEAIASLYIENFPVLIFVGRNAIDLVNRTPSAKSSEILTNGVAADNIKIVLVPNKKIEEVTSLMKTYSQPPIPHIFALESFMSDERYSLLTH